MPARISNDYPCANYPVFPTFPTCSDFHATQTAVISDFSDISDIKGKWPKPTERHLRFEACAVRFGLNWPHVSLNVGNVGKVGDSGVLCCFEVGLSWKSWEHGEIIFGNFSARKDLRNLGTAPLNTRVGLLLRISLSVRERFP